VKSNDDPANPGSRSAAFAFEDALTALLLGRAWQPVTAESCPSLD
jgi:hypothetical protein